MEVLIKTIRIYSQDIEMEFSTEKCAMLIMKNEKSETTKGIELANQKSIRTLRENENYMYLRKLKTGIIIQR